MQDSLAQSVIEMWSGGAGVVPRGPKMLMGVVPAMPGDVERHTGRRAPIGDIWRLEVGGRFLASGGLVYPGGVPFPEELHDTTAVIANEVWLYADENGAVLGAYWWPDAVRKPIASVPRDEYAGEVVVDVADASRHTDVPLPLPEHPSYTAAVAVCFSNDEVLVFCVAGQSPDPLNEMLVYEHGGLSVRARRGDGRVDVEDFLRSHQPPYRRMKVNGAPAVAREVGRSLGPQTWPWPAELRWWRGGVAYEIKAFATPQTLIEVAESIPT